MPWSCPSPPSTFVCGTWPSGKGVPGVAATTLSFSSTNSKLYRDRRCGIADSCGPYRPVLSYNSNRGTARSFIFLGTERTSTSTHVRHSSLGLTEIGGLGGTLTLLWQLNEIQFLTLLRPRHMSRKERIHESLEIRPPPLRERITDLPILVHALTRELRSDRSQTLV